MLPNNLNLVPTFRGLLNHLIHVHAHERAVERMLEKLGVTPAEFRAAYQEERKPHDDQFQTHTQERIESLGDRELSAILRELQKLPTQPR